MMKVRRILCKSELVRSLYHKLFPRLTISFFPTFFCNYDCPHCVYNTEQYSKKYPRKVEHSWEEWVKVFDKFEPARISIVGGEPFLYPNLVPLINRMPKKHAIGLSTNLSLPIDDFIENVKRDIGICASFHPHRADINSFITKVLELREHGFKNQLVNFVAHPDTVPLLPQLKSFFEGKGLEFHVEAWIYPSYQYTEQEAKIVKKYTDCPKLGFDSTQKVKRCFAGSKYFMVVPNGDVYTCNAGFFYTTQSKLHERFWSPRKEFYLGNLFDNSFSRLTNFKICSAPCSEACDIRGASVKEYKT